MSKLTPKTKPGMRARRHNRVRAKVVGTEKRPRLAVFRSNTAMYAQLIDDAKGVTLASATSSGMAKTSMMEQAVFVGTHIAKAGKEKGITEVVFDRGGFTYTGRIKALAEAARSEGLIF